MTVRPSSWYPHTWLLFQLLSLCPFLLLYHTQRHARLTRPGLLAAWANMTRPGRLAAWERVTRPGQSAVTPAPLGRHTLGGVARSSQSAAYAAEGDPAQPTSYSLPCTRMTRPVCGSWHTITQLTIFEAIFYCSLAQAVLSLNFNTTSLYKIYLTLCSDRCYTVTLTRIND